MSLHIPPSFLAVCYSFFRFFLIGALVKRLNKFNTKIRIFLDAVEDKENMILFNEQSADKRNKMH